MDLTSKTLFLTQKEFNKVFSVIRDVQKSISCDIALGGSLAQRVLRPEFAKTLAGKRVSDIDLVLLGGSLSACPVLPTIKKYFYITYIKEMHDGYYFGMIHKKTGRWVDLLTDPYEKQYKNIEIGGVSYKVSNLETQILWMARDIIWRIVKKLPIHKKYLNKLAWFLAAPSTDMAGLEQEYQSHQQHYLKKVPDDKRGELSNARKYILYAIEQGMFYDRDYKVWDKVGYPTDCVMTSNGITIESKVTFKMLFFYHLWDFLTKKC